MGGNHIAFQKEAIYLLFQPEKRPVHSQRISGNARERLLSFALCYSSLSLSENKVLTRRLRRNYREICTINSVLIGIPVLSEDDMALGRWYSVGD